MSLNDNQSVVVFIFSFSSPQYLKKNGGVNLLQFCLAVEDFNKKMMVSFYISILIMMMTMMVIFLFIV